jgi:HAMP domain-containing protein
MLRYFTKRFKNLKLATKLNTLLLIIFVGGITVSSIAFANLLNYQAEIAVKSRARFIFQNINAVRQYTNDEVQPVLERRLKEDEFALQSIPAYSARRVFVTLQKQDATYNDFFYKDAMLNPTNLQDLADSFETTIVQKFQQANNLENTTSGYRWIDGEKYFYIASPLALTEQSCLRCHSSPDVAPKGMLKIYGPENGFGWKLNEINGTQIVSVPANIILARASQALILAIGIITLVFAIAIYVANFWLKQYVIQPIERVVRVAEAVSTGDFDAEFEKVSKDEIGSLVEAFTRMKLSLLMAIQSFEQNRPKG